MKKWAAAALLSAVLMFAAFDLVRQLVNAIFYVAQSHYNITKLK